MGSLRLPTSGLVYLDSNCLIYSVEKIQPYSRLLEPIWRQAGAGSLTLVCSEMALLETLIKPLREHDELLQRLYSDLLQNAGSVELVPVDRSVILRAAQVRADLGLNTPDAIHAASAELAGCQAFVTNDSAFRKLTSIRVAVLADTAMETKD